MKTSITLICVLLLASCTSRNRSTVVTKSEVAEKNTAPKSPIRIAYDDVEAEEQKPKVLNTHNDILTEAKAAGSTKGITRSVNKINLKDFSSKSFHCKTGIVLKNNNDLFSNFALQVNIEDNGKKTCNVFLGDKGGNKILSQECSLQVNDTSLTVISNSDDLNVLLKRSSFNFMHGLT
jgi:hypothetical protein